MVTKTAVNSAECITILATVNYVFENRGFECVAKAFSSVFGL
jgi:hypothetical protein